MPTSPTGLKNKSLRLRHPPGLRGRLLPVRYQRLIPAAWPGRPLHAVPVARAGGGAGRPRAAGLRLPGPPRWGGLRAGRDADPHRCGVQRPACIAGPGRPPLGNQRAA